MKQGDRVKLDRDYKISISNITLKSKTIGTIRDFITSENIALIQYGYNKDKDQILIVGIPTDQLSKVNEEDLRSLDHINLIPGRWHTGNYVMKNDTEELYLLKDIQLKLNESDDLYTLLAQDGISLSKLTRFDLENKTIPIESPIIASLVNKETENLELESNYKTNDELENTNLDVKEELEESEESNSNIELNIDGFKFIIEIADDGNRVITSTEITEKNISSYYDAIYKINKIMNWR